MQNNTSANTSINKRLPALFGKLPDNIRNCQMLDYGCGKYPEYVRQWAEKRGISVTSYDKYNYLSDNWYKDHGYDVVTLSNVLNVIDNWIVRWGILEDCFDCLRDGGQLYITVYEGDKTGIGRRTKSDCWQENKKLSDYLFEVEEIFGQNNVTMKKGMIIAKKED